MSERRAPPFLPTHRESERSPAAACRGCAGPAEPSCLLSPFQEQITGHDSCATEHLLRSSRDMARSLALTGLLLSLLLPSAPAASAKNDPSNYRAAVIARAQVWQPTDIAAMDLKTGPTEPTGFALGETINCSFVHEKLGGKTPKFACRTADGEQLKVKYGGINGEVYAEVLASRLLWALGFGADHMYSVRVVCRGCPKEVGGTRRADRDRIVDPAAVERKMPGRALLERLDLEDLDLMNEDAGGATKAERDAFKLLAVLLQHSDSKPTNQ